ncbi:MAG: MucR family transcriptional regulator [Pseudonocardiales bacterium]|nr:MucR family transcriptional regulator [Pseudonocardiales bacterium]
MKQLQIYGNTGAVIMTSIAAEPVNRSQRGHTHGHLWSLSDGTALHAPYGQLVTESGTGRVCCHLCGRWYVSLGGHLRTHGHTADSYRETMGLCRSRPLVAEALSRSIATRLGWVKLRREVDAAGIAVRPANLSSAQPNRDPQGCVGATIAR